MGTLVLAGATSGSTTLTPVDAVTTVLTLPSVTATLATLGANTFTGNQSITGTLGVTGNATFDTDTLFVDAANNRVGIGTTSPGAKLHVSGSGTNTGFVKIENTTSDEATINFVTTHPSNYRVGASILVSGGFEIYDATAALNRLAISSTGAVTIPGTLGVTGAGFTFSGAGLGNFGTTTSGAGIGTTLQSFTFDSSTASGASPHDICATFKNDNSAGQTLILWNAVNSGDPFWIKFYTEPTGSASLRGSINYNRTGGLTAYNTTSDYRAKNIAGPLENTGATIDKLKVYLGTMRGATIARPMLIAHEAQEIVPYAVTGTKDQVDKNGEPEFQQMDHQSFVPLLLAEIQSLRARLAALENK